MPCKKVKALLAIEYAISIGIKNDGKYPDRIAYSLRGELLEEQNRPTEAAEAYFEAGIRYSWQDEFKTAIELLSKANELNPGYVPIYWHLSDALRMNSYTTELPFVDKNLIEQSIAIWEQGVKIQLPDSDYSWSYISRALINEQLTRLPNADRWTLCWEAVVYLERALLLGHWSVSSKLVFRIKCSR